MSQIQDSENCVFMPAVSLVFKHKAEARQIFVEPMAGWCREGKQRNRAGRCCKMSRGDHIPKRQRMQSTAVRWEVKEGPRRLTCLLMPYPLLESTMCTNVW